MPRVLFRCDESPALGLGHVSRCLALAQALRERDVDAALVTAGDPTRMRRAGFDSLRIADAAPEFHESLADIDLRATLAIAAEYEADMIVVDHYGADEPYLDGIAARGLKLGVVDDLARRRLDGATWVLNAAAGAGELCYRLSPATRAFFGPQFALIRAETLACRRKLSRRFAEDDAHVLVTLGGGESTARVERIIAELEALDRPLAIRSPAGGLDARLFAQSLVWADVVVSAGGATAWECCCLGAPTVTVALEANQRPNQAFLANAECALPIGAWSDEHTPTLAAREVAALLAAPQRRREMSARGQELVDGRGAARVAAEIEQMCSVRSEARG